MVDTIGDKTGETVESLLAKADIPEEKRKAIANEVKEITKYSIGALGMYFINKGVEKGLDRVEDFVDKFKIKPQIQLADANTGKPIDINNNSKDDTFNDTMKYDDNGKTRENYNKTVSEFSKQKDKEASSNVHQFAKKDNSSKGSSGKDLKSDVNNNNQNNNKNSQNDVHPSAPVGAKGRGDKFFTIRNKPGTINGINYSGHAYDEMRSQNIMPSQVEGAIEYSIKNNEIYKANTADKVIYYDPGEGVKVVFGIETKTIVTVTYDKNFLNKAKKIEK